MHCIYHSYNLNLSFCKGKKHSINHDSEDHFDFPYNGNSKNPLFEQSYPYVRYKKFQIKYDNTKSVEYFIAPLYILSKIVNRSSFFDGFRRT